MTTSEVKSKFDQYQEFRNLYVATMASSNTTMNVIPDPEAHELLMIMRSIYDFAYSRAINDAFSMTQIDFPNDSIKKEI